MKKINITVILLLALALVFTGCRGEVSEDTTAPPTVTLYPTETTSQGTTAEETTSEPETTECTHIGMITREIIPNCTENYKVESYCHICGYTEYETMPPYGHSFVNNICTICGYNIESDAIEAARKFLGLPADAVLYLKEKSPSNPFCYKIAYCEFTDAEFIGDFEVKREVFVDQRTGECTEVDYSYPEIPEVFLDVIFNREKFLYVEQTLNSSGEYKYTTSEALFKDLSVHHSTIFGAQTLGYYVTDIDGDSIHELIFPGAARSHYGMLFRVYEGKVYGYACILDGLCTDATYRWHEQAGNYVGRSQVYFDGIFYKSRRLTECDKNDPNNIIYYVEGKETTKEKYDAFESAHSNEELQYYTLDYYPVYVNPFPGG